MSNLESVIKAKVDLADYVSQYTTLKRTGNTWRGACPIHGGENTSAFTVFPHGTFYCFSCGACGNVINFVAEYEHITYEAATEKLADMLNIDVSTNAEYVRQRDLIQDYRHRVVTASRNLESNEELQSYLSKRGIGEEVARLFHLGADKQASGSLVIPIYNVNDQPVAIAKRYFNAKYKYKNSKNSEVFDKSETLYGLNVSRKIGGGVLYLVEGYFDVMSGTEMGLPTAGYCGAEIGKEQIQLLNKTVPPNTQIILVPDMDEAGLKHIDRVRERFNSITNFNVRVCPLPDGCKDMNDALVNGVDVKGLPTVYIDQFVLVRKLDECNSIEDQYSYATEFMKTVKNQMVKADLVDILAKRWGKDATDLKDAFDLDGDEVDSLTDNAATLYDCLGDLGKLYEKGIFKTGIAGIDNCVGGIMKGQVVVVGAYSGSGKTSFAIDYILKSILHNDMRVVFFSQEMSKGNVLEWILAKLIGCPFYQVREHFANSEEIKKQLDKIGNRLIIIDKNGVTMDEIDRTISAINAKGLFDRPVDMVVCDYFQYLKGTEEYDGAAQQAKAMKRIAKDKDLIFVMLSQLNRQSNQYEEPTMNLLKGAGDIEASADICLLMWRPDLRPGIGLEAEQKWHGVTRFNLAKVRGYQLGSTRFMMKWSRDKSMLEDCEDED